MARNPTLIMATNGFRPKDISTDATSAASAHGFMACDHCMGRARTGTVWDAGRALASCEAAAVAKVRGDGAGSAMTTRICGAEQCGQKGTPSSTVCPHL